MFREPYWWGRAPDSSSTGGAKIPAKCDVFAVIPEMHGITRLILSDCRVRGGCFESVA